MADNIELTEHPGSPTDPHAQSSATSLAQCDGGYAAWRLLLAAFVFEALLWGERYRIISF